MYFLKLILLSILRNNRRLRYYVNYIRKVVFSSNNIVLHPDNRFQISSSAHLKLGGLFDLNSNNYIRNGRTSILRMDENSQLITKGNFSFMYGADIILFNNAKLILGNNSFINSDCKIRCHKEISIGDECAIAHDFTVMDSDAHEINGIRCNKPVHIGNHVWIGTRVTILSGVTVGDDAVIAAGSLVNKDVPSNTLVGGIPARILKEKVKWKA